MTIAQVFFLHCLIGGGTESGTQTEGRTEYTYRDPGLGGGGGGYVSQLR